MSRVLVVYFSRTGYTKTVAEGVATRCGADVEAVRERRGRRGFSAIFGRHARP
jgi:flavodoxin